jgi:hypothetical protein
MTLELMTRLKAWLSADPDRHEFCLSRNEVQQIVEALGMARYSHGFDYRKILLAYMDYVSQQEGIDFLPALNAIDGLSEEETGELNQLSANSK